MSQGGRPKGALSHLDVAINAEVCRKYARRALSFLRCQWPSPRVCTSVPLRPHPLFIIISYTLSFRIVLQFSPAACSYGSVFLSRSLERQRTPGPYPPGHGVYRSKFWSTGEGGSGVHAWTGGVEVRAQNTTYRSWRDRAQRLQRGRIGFVKLEFTTRLLSFR